MIATDHFDRLGLPRQFDLDTAALEHAYLVRSREWHPDRHQQGSTSDQAAALEMTALLNESYRVLRDPFRRAEHLLGLEGGPTAAEQKDMPPEFLEEILELRMEIEDLNEHGNESNTAAMAQRLKDRETAILTDVGVAFTDLSTAADRPSVLRALRRRLNALKYVQNLVRDLQ